MSGGEPVSPSPDALAHIRMLVTLPARGLRVIGREERADVEIVARIGETDESKGNLIAGSSGPGGRQLRLSYQLLCWSF